MTLPGKIMIISIQADPLARPGSLQHNSNSVYVKELTRALDNAGIGADVFTYGSNPRTPRIQPMGKRTRVIRLSGGKKSSQHKPITEDNLQLITEELERYADKGQYSIIHSNCRLSALSALKLKRSRGIPYVYLPPSLEAAATGHSGSDMGEHNHQDQEIVREADRVIVTTKTEKEKVMKAFNLQPEKINIVGCGVNTSLFRPMNKASAKRRFPSKANILFVGGLDENKGLKVLLKALSLLKKENPKLAGRASLAVVGGKGRNTEQNSDHAETAELLQRIKESGLTDFVRLTNYLKYEEMPSCYADADITVVPSYNDSLGLVALEAMASGSPVIASRTGGLAVHVIDGKTGLLVEPGNARELTLALYQLLSDGNLRREMAGHAAARGKRFSWLKTAFSLVDLYEEVGGWQEVYFEKVHHSF